MFRARVAAQMNSVSHAVRSKRISDGMKRAAERGKIRGWIMTPEIYDKIYTDQRNLKIAATMRKVWEKRREGIAELPGDGTSKRAKRAFHRATQPKAASQQSPSDVSLVQQIANGLTEAKIIFVKDFVIDRTMFDFFLFAYSMLIIADDPERDPAKLAGMRSTASKEGYDLVIITAADVATPWGILRKVAQLDK
jgi:hypothetical protein